MINVNKLNKFFNKGKQNEIHVINDVSLTLPDNGFITILGPSGSGKTTLLNIIGGLDKASGELIYDEQAFVNYDMKKIDQFRKDNIGYVFQNYNLLADKTVGDNLKIALEVIGISDKDEVKKRIDYCLKAVGLYKYRKKYAHALSGGQMQRVSIARALIKNSKLIIADEPTGNLDSENSLEVMNILKKISEKSLVLLVTHDKQLAEYYSDKIIEICDGKIINIRDANINASLSGKDSDNLVFLKDMNKIESVTPQLTYQIYSKKENLEKFDFTIVEHNGHFYLKSNQKLKLLEDTPLTLLDSHYDSLKKHELKSDFTYNTDWYNNTKTSNALKTIGGDFKNSIKKIFTNRKRTKFFHMVFILIGMIIAFANITYSNFSHVNVNFGYDRSLYGVENPYEMTTSALREYYEALEEAYDANLINNLYNRYSYYSVWDFQISSFKHVTYESNYLILSADLIKDDELLMGRMPNDSQEIVLGKDLADSILKKFENENATYEALINKTPSLDTKIVGVSAKKSMATYTLIADGVNFALMDGKTDYSKTPEVAFFDYEKDFVEILYENPAIPDNKAYYLNIEGFRDFDFNSYTEAEIAEFYEYYVNNWERERMFFKKGSHDDHIVLAFKGFYRTSKDLPDFMVKNADIALTDSQINNQYSVALYCFPENSVESDYEIVEGTDIINNRDCIVSAYSDIPVGMEINGLKVVGKYVAKNIDFNNKISYGIVSTALVKDSKVINFLSVLSYSFGANHLFSTDDIERLKTFMSEKGFALDDVFELNVLRQKNNNKNSRKIVLPIIAILVSMSLIYIYFSTRSKMLNDIYSIGVYRLLGFSRSKITCTYMIDIFVTSLFTTLLGYLFTSGVYDALSSSLNNFGFNMPLVFFSANTYIILFAMIVLNVVIGLIPIVSLVQKTPIQIISKYDI